MESRCAVRRHGCSAPWRSCIGPRARFLLRGAVSGPEGYPGWPVTVWQQLRMRAMRTGRDSAQVTVSVLAVAGQPDAAVLAAGSLPARNGRAVRAVTADGSAGQLPG